MYDITNFCVQECYMQVDNDSPVMGISPSYMAICDDYLASSEDLILETGLQDHDYYILPIKREPQCVTKLPCN